MAKSRRGRVKQDELNKVIEEEKEKKVKIVKKETPKIFTIKFKDLKNTELVTTKGKTYVDSNGIAKKVTKAMLIELDNVRLKYDIIEKE